MSALLIKNAIVILPDRLLPGQAVLCQDGKIATIAPEHDIRNDQPKHSIDGGGNYLAPGYIDLHIHGVHDKLVNSGPKDLEEMCRILPKYGVTGFLPTVVPFTPGQDTELLGALANISSEGTSVLGFFLEGPFLALPGAIGAEALKERTVERIASLKKAVEPYRAIFAASPDVEGIHNLMPCMAENKTPVFMTHTAADVEQTLAAIESGGRHATHFYDVTPCPAERDSGVRPCGFVEAVLADARVSVDFILDGEHVHPAAVKMALKCKGPDRVCLITDANLGAGLPPGRYKGFSGEEIEFAYEGAPARGTENSSIPGTLFGSGLTMDRAVQNAVKFLGVDIPLAVRMASMNPAQVLGLSEKKGQIKVGCDADLVLLDKNLYVLQTWVQGKCCFQNETGGVHAI